MSSVEISMTYVGECKTEINSNSIKQKNPLICFVVDMLIAMQDACIVKRFHHAPPPPSYLKFI